MELDREPRRRRARGLGDPVALLEDEHELTADVVVDRLRERRDVLVDLQLERVIVPLARRLPRLNV